MECSVTFRVSAPCSAGETVHLVGSTSALGSWNLNEAIALSTAPECFPVWFTARPIRLPVGAVVEYKYAVNAPDGTIARWEGIDGNRCVTPAPGLREMMVEDILDVTPPSPSPTTSLTATGTPTGSAGGGAEGSAFFPDQTGSSAAAAGVPVVHGTSCNTCSHQHGAAAVAAPTSGSPAAHAHAHGHAATASAALPSASPAANAVLAAGAGIEPQHPRDDGLPDPDHDTHGHGHGHGAHGRRRTGSAPIVTSHMTHSGHGVHGSPPAVAHAAAGGGFGSSGGPGLSATAAAAQLSIGDGSGRPATSTSAGAAHHHALAAAASASPSVSASSSSASSAAGAGISPAAAVAAVSPPTAGDDHLHLQHHQHQHQHHYDGSGSALDTSAASLTDGAGDADASYSGALGSAGSSSSSGAGGGGGTDVFGRDRLTEGDGVLIVQFRLPVRISRRCEPGSGAPIPGAFDIEWDAEALLAPKIIPRGGGAAVPPSALARARIKWIGTLPLSDVTAEEEEALRRALDAFGCVPVFIPPHILAAYYDGYCRDTLWPIFHNVIDVYGDLPTRWWLTARQSERWKSYMDANGRFASAVVECFHEGDMVWIQDFHLLLVPMLLARRHIAPVGIFLHSPFPSSEIFRSLSMRDELLRGMLHADQVGFHLFEYARHFLTCCRRILGLTHASKRGGVIAVDMAGREVQVSVSHVGIEPSFLLHAFASAPAVIATTAAWRAMFPGRAIVAGIDSIERLRGVPLKLLAWEHFLATHPQWLGRAVLVQYLLADTARPGDTQESSLREIVTLAQRINARFARPASPAAVVEYGSARASRSLGEGDDAMRRVPAVYLLFRRSDTEQLAVSVQERAALWAASDVLINTAINDGLNLHPFEFSFCRGERACVAAGLRLLQQTEAGDAAATTAATAADGGLPLPLPITRAVLSEDTTLETVKHHMLAPPQVPPCGPAVDVCAAAPDASGSSAGSSSDSSSASSSSSSSKRSREPPRVSAAAAASLLSDLSPGVLILSEFSGCSRVLPGAMRVNPWKVEEVVAALHHALTMSSEEAAARLSSSLQYVTGNTTSGWAERILTDLKAASKRSVSRTYMGYGLGLGYRLMGFGASFKPLNVETLVQAYRRAGRRLIVCDYGGTLHVRDSHVSRKHAFELGLLGRDAAAPLTPETRRALRILSEDVRNTVFIISGKEKDVMAQAFAGLPNVGLAAEHGFTYRWGAPRLKAGGSGGSDAASTGSGATASERAGSGGGLLRRQGSADSTTAGAGSSSSAAAAAGASSAAAGAGSVDNGMPWQQLVRAEASVTADWFSLAGGIMEGYTARTNGTYILRKGSALSWFYGDADPEFGLLQAKELQDHLTGVLAAYPVDVLSGSKYVEVRPRGVHKGAVLSLVIDILEGRDLFTHHRREEGKGGSGAGADGSSAGSGGAGADGGSAPPGAAKGSAAAAAASAVRSPPRPGTSDAPAASGSGSGNTSGTGGTSGSGRSSSTAAAGSAGGDIIRYAIPPGRDPTTWKSGPLDFILVIGDDAADESMFATLAAYRKERAAEHRALIARVSAAQAAALGSAYAVTAHDVMVGGRAGLPTPVASARGAETDAAAAVPGGGCGGPAAAAVRGVGSSSGGGGGGSATSSPARPGAITTTGHPAGGNGSASGGGGGTTPASTAATAGTSSSGSSGSGTAGAAGTGTGAALTAAATAAATVVAAARQPVSGLEEDVTATSAAPRVTKFGAGLLGGSDETSRASTRYLAAAGAISGAAGGGGSGGGGRPVSQRAGGLPLGPGPGPGASAGAGAGPAGGARGTHAPPHTAPATDSGRGSSTSPPAGTVVSSSNGSAASPSPVASPARPGAAGAATHPDHTHHHAHYHAHTEADAAAAAAAASAFAGSAFAEFSVTVGKKPSAASYFLDDTSQVEDALKALAKATAKARGLALGLSLNAGAAASSASAGHGAGGGAGSGAHGDVAAAAAGAAGAAALRMGAATVASGLGSAVASAAAAALGRGLAASPLSSTGLAGLGGQGMRMPTPAAAAASVVAAGSLAQLAVSQALAQRLAASAASPAAGLQSSGGMGMGLGMGIGMMSLPAGIDKLARQAQAAQAAQAMLAGAQAGAAHAAAASASAAAGPLGSPGAVLPGGGAAGRPAVAPAVPMGMTMPVTGFSAATSPDLAALLRQSQAGSAAAGGSPGLRGPGPGPGPTGIAGLPAGAVTFSVPLTLPVSFTAPAAAVGATVPAAGTAGSAVPRPARGASSFFDALTSPPGASSGSAAAPAGAADASGSSSSGGGTAGSTSVAAGSASGSDAAAGTPVTASTVPLAGGSGARLLSNVRLGMPQAMAGLYASSAGAASSGRLASYGALAALATVAETGSRSGGGESPFTGATGDDDAGSASVRAQRDAASSSYTGGSASASFGALQPSPPATGSSGSAAFGPAAGRMAPAGGGALPERDSDGHADSGADRDGEDENEDDDDESDFYSDEEDEEGEDGGVSGRRDRDADDGSDSVPTRGTGTPGATSFGVGGALPGYGSSGSGIGGLGMGMGQRFAGSGAGNAFPAPMAALAPSPLTGTGIGVGLGRGFGSGVRLASSPLAASAAGLAAGAGLGGGVGMGVRIAAAPMAGAGQLGLRGSQSLGALAQLSAAVGSPIGAAAAAAAAVQSQAQAQAQAQTRGLGDYLSSIADATAADVPEF